MAKIWYEVASYQLLQDVGFTEDAALQAIAVKVEALIMGVIAANGAGSADGVDKLGHSPNNFDDDLIASIQTIKTNEFDGVEFADTELATELGTILTNIITNGLTNDWFYHPGEPWEVAHPDIT